MAASTSGLRAVEVCCGRITPNCCVLNYSLEYQECQSMIKDGKVKLTLDLHDIYNRNGDIDRALRAIIEEAVAKKAPLVEIIPGKGSGALKKHVLRFLDQAEIKAQYHRVEKDSKNFGRIFVHFRPK
jgi:DNA-nicking Smr family endonuclease